MQMRVNIQGKVHLLNTFQEQKHFWSKLLYFIIYIFLMFGHFTKLEVTSGLVLKLFATEHEHITNLNYICLKTTFFKFNLRRRRELGKERFVADKSALFNLWVKVLFFPEVRQLELSSRCRHAFIWEQCTSRQGRAFSYRVPSHMQKNNLAKRGAALHHRCSPVLL